AWASDVHVLVGVIESGNRPSIRLHQQLGFMQAGTLREVGRKFDRWLDVDLYQLKCP
ncbi:MAG: GNAT family N-acetyltransferase, partial [Betaproteobacteria bacterium]|nr:GNAT family N-acetyltransferase [Betaproteobacteria bacterium]